MQVYPTYSNPRNGEEVISASPFPARIGSASTSSLSDPDTLSAISPTSNIVISASLDEGTGFPSGGVEIGNDDSDSGDPDDGVNVGAIVGGVVGGLVVIAIFSCVLAFLLLRHRRQKRRDTITAAITGSHVPELKAEMPAQEPVLSLKQPLNGSVSASEPIMIDGTPLNLSGAVRYELPSNTNPT